MRRSALVVVVVVMLLMTESLSMVLTEDIEREEQYGKLGFGEDQEESGLLGKIKAIPKKIALQVVNNLMGASIDAIVIAVSRSAATKVATAGARTQSEASCQLQALCDWLFRKLYVINDVMVKEGEDE